MTDEQIYSNTQDPFTRYILNKYIYLQIVKLVSPICPLNSIRGFDMILLSKRKKDGLFKLQISMRIKITIVVNKGNKKKLTMCR